MPSVRSVTTQCPGSPRTTQHKPDGQSSLVVRIVAGARRLMPTLFNGFRRHTGAAEMCVFLCSRWSRNQPSSVGEKSHSHSSSPRWELVRYRGFSSMAQADCACDDRQNPILISQPRHIEHDLVTLLTIFSASVFGRPEITADSAMGSEL
jgi:hypothetical protein